jgi:hypothetical protein
MEIAVLRHAAMAVPLLCTMAAAGEELALQTILDNTNVEPPSRVSFREVRHNRMLQDDLVITGYLEYLEVGSLHKVIQTPFEESYLIESERIEIDRDGVTRTLSLKRSRSLKTMLGGIEAILAGDSEKLAGVFNYELSGAEENWELLLQPRSKRIARQVRGLTVTGNSSSVTTIRFDLNDGEWHRMEILKDDTPQ